MPATYLCWAQVSNKTAEQSAGLHWIVTLNTTLINVHRSDCLKSNTDIYFFQSCSAGGSYIEGIWPFILLFCCYFRHPAEWSCTFVIVFLRSSLQWLSTACCNPLQLIVFFLLNCLQFHKVTEVNYTLLMKLWMTSWRGTLFSILLLCL
jgi:hypothetical protein